MCRRNDGPASCFIISGKPKSLNGIKGTERWCRQNQVKLNCIVHPQLQTKMYCFVSKLNLWKEKRRGKIVSTKNGAKNRSRTLFCRFVANKVNLSWRRKMRKNGVVRKKWNQYAAYPPQVTDKNEMFCVKNEIFYRTQAAEKACWLKMMQQNSSVHPQATGKWHSKTATGYLV